MKEKVLFPRIVYAVLALAVAGILFFTQHQPVLASPVFQNTIPGIVQTEPSFTKDEVNTQSSIPNLQFPFCGTWQIQGAYGDGQHNGQYNAYAIDWANRTPGEATYDALIYAAHDGTVIYAQTDSYGSNTLVLRTYDGAYVSMYGHLHTFAKNVGDSVAQGEVIGQAGDSGTTSAHLHFAFGQTYGSGTWFWNGIPPEPMSGGTGFAYPQFHTRTCSPLSPTDNATFSAQSDYPSVQTDSNFQITFDLTNTGTTTWTPGNYWLQNVNGAALGASAQQPITSNVVPGQTYRWTINMTAPSTTGVYRTQWAPSHNGTIFGLVGVSMYIDVTVTTLCDTVTEIPKIECNSLVSLYNSTNGANWTTKTGWLQSSTPCSWYGVTCSAGHVTEVRLNKNNLVGTIPATLENLSALTRLSLHTNQLSGHIPPELGNLSNLTVLALSINQLSGSIPPELGNLSKLVYLLLGTDQLSGNIPPELGNLSQLNILTLDTNQFTGSIPPQLGNLSQLRELWLSGNSLTGNIPASLGNLSHLTYLNVSENQLSNSIPTQLGNLTSLDYLNLSNNQFTGSIPPTFGNLTNLASLNLYGNLLSGPIPTELSNLTNLSTLVLSGNQLSGSMPTWLGNMTSLTWLELSYNWELTGSIPGELGNLANLTYLNLGSTHLSGSIPPQLGNLTNLWFLGLYDNQVSGSIPPELGNLTNLNYLRLDNTQLNGEIPTSVTNLVKITDLTLACGLTSSNTSVIAFVSALSPGWQNRICPTLIEPQNDAIVDNGRSDQLDDITWDFSWSTIPNATKYHLYVVHAGAPIPVIDDAVISGSSYRYISQSSYITETNRYDWQWKVRAYINGQWGSWSEIRTFSVEPIDTDHSKTLTTAFTSLAAQDGWVLESSEGSNTGSLLNATDPTFNLGDNAAKKQYRGMLSFNTSTLPDNAIITAITLKIKKNAIFGGGNPVTIFQGFMVDVKPGFFGTSSSLQTSDFQAIGGKTYGPFSSASISNWYSMNLINAKTSINKLTTNSGLTQMRLRFALDDNNNAIANYLSIFSANATAANRPQLIIEYYVR